MKDKVGILTYTRLRPQHHINSLTNPQKMLYTVLSTPRVVGRVGTVNSCTCLFFSRTHSECKHMYIIAGRLRFNVKELVTVESSRSAAQVQAGPAHETYPMPSRLTPSEVHHGKDVTPSSSSAGLHPVTATPSLPGGAVIPPSVAPLGSSGVPLPVAMPPPPLVPQEAAAHAHNAGT